MHQKRAITEIIVDLKLPAVIKRFSIKTNTLSEVSQPQIAQ